MGPGSQLPALNRFKVARWCLTSMLHSRGAFEKSLDPQPLLARLLRRGVRCRARHAECLHRRPRSPAPALQRQRSNRLEARRPRQHDRRRTASSTPTAAWACSTGPAAKSATATSTSSTACATKTIIPASSSAFPLEPREEWMPVHYGYEVQIDNHPEAGPTKTNITPPACSIRSPNRSPRPGSPAPSGTPWTSRSTARARSWFSTA